MPDPKSIEERLKDVETIAARLVGESRAHGEKLHGIYEEAEQANEAVVVLRSLREKGVDWIARTIGIIALAGVCAMGLHLLFKHGDIRQDVKQDVRFDRPATMDELVDGYVRDATNVQPGDE